MKLKYLVAPLLFAAAAATGELLLNAYVNNLVKLFDLLKKDDVPGELQEEFYMQCYDPQV